jgi:hypothetical protein
MEKYKLPINPLSKNKTHPFFVVFHFLNLLLKVSHQILFFKLILNVLEKSDCIIE